MSYSNKIPFGLRKSDNALVDVYEVQNGKQSGCICPSCQTPLEARQGAINVWHFAHSSKKVYEKTKNECEYSFYLSVRLMARQLIGKQAKLCLPECEGTIEYYEGVHRFTQWKEFIVSNQQDKIIDNIEVEKTFSGVAVDLIGMVEAFKFVVYFSYPGRNVPKNLFNPTESKCGIIQIELDLLLSQFKLAKAEGKTYHQILTDFLVNDRISKRWIYHPRFEKAASQALEQLQKKASNPISYSIWYGNNENQITHLCQNTDKRLNDRPEKCHNFSTEIKPPSKSVHYECVMCKLQWDGYETGGNICPKCKSYLFSKQIV